MLIGACQIDRLAEYPSFFKGYFKLVPAFAFAFNRQCFTEVFIAGNISDFGMLTGITDKRNSVIISNVCFFWHLQNLLKDGSKVSPDQRGYK